MAQWILKITPMAKIIIQLVFRAMVHGVHEFIVRYVLDNVVDVVHCSTTGFFFFYRSVSHLLPEFAEIHWNPFFCLPLQCFLCRKTPKDNKASLMLKIGKVLFCDCVQRVPLLVPSFQNTSFLSRYCFLDFRHWLFWWQCSKVSLWWLFHAVQATVQSRAGHHHSWVS